MPGHARKDIVRFREIVTYHCWSRCVPLHKGLPLRLPSGDRTGFQLPPGPDRRPAGLPGQCICNRCRQLQCAELPRPRHAPHSVPIELSIVNSNRSLEWRHRRKN